jgi:hypothetical protein
MTMPRKDMRAASTVVGVVDCRSGATHRVYFVTGDEPEISGAVITRDATTAKRPILNIFLKIRTLVLNLRSLTIARNFWGR